MNDLESFTTTADNGHAASFSGDQSWTGEEILNYLPGSTWSMDALIPDRDKDPIEPGHHFKTPEGWTIGSHPDMTVTDRQIVHALILQHKSAFAYALSDLSGYTGPEPEFMLGAPGESVVLPPGNHIHPPRSRSPLEEQVIDEHMTPLRDAGFIERAKFALKSHEPVVAAKKNPETGEWTDKRCCVNYGEGCGGINKYTKLDPYQLPLPEDLYARTAGCKFFSVIDLKSGFSNTKMHESVRPLAAFWWNRELWVTTRNTFGLKNMPAYFQRVVDRTIRDAGLSNCVCGFIDDLLIFTVDLESHKAAITKLFDALAAVGLKAHPGKSRFCFDTIEYLGHNISSYGLSPNDVKVAAIRALPIPSNVHELRRVLGFINYYRVYCPMFFDTAAPLNQLLKKNTPWKWDVEQDLALNALKEAICKPGNALKHPDRNRRMQTTLSAKAQSQVAQCAPLLSSVPSSTPTTLQFTEDNNGITYSSINTSPLPSSNVHSAFHGGVTILELFGGMVSGLDCILRNGVHVHRYYYCDKSPSARRVAANRLHELSMRYPHQFPFEAWSTAFTAFPQDVYEITEQHLISAGCMNESQWLFIAGFECADLSSAGNRTGLQGHKSDTFYPMLNILGMLQSLQHSLPPIYLIENTAVQHARSSSTAMHAAFEELCLRIGTPVVLDAARVNSYAHRLRNYWTNLASSASLQITLDSYERDSTLFLSDVLDSGHTPQICRSVHGAPYYPANKKDLPLFVLPTLVARHQSYAFSVRDDVIGSGLVLDTAGNLVDLTIQERERILGYPTDCTQADGVSISQRHALTGGCFDAFAVSHLLATAFAIHSVIYDGSHSFISLSALAVTSELGGGPDEYDSDDSDYPGVSVHALFTDSAYLLQDAAHSLLADAEDTAHANSSVEVDVWLDDNVLSYLKNSSTDLLDKFNDTERRRVLRRSKFYAWDGSQLFRKFTDGSTRQVPHPDNRLELVRKIHEDNGHYGRRRTIALTALSYWWFGLWQVCRKVVSSCHACAQTKTSFNAQSPVLNSLPLKGMMYRWNVDLCGPFPVTTRGHKYVMVAIEHFTKFVEVFPLKDKSAPEVAYNFLHGVIARYGACAEVVTDGGGEFQGEFENLLFRTMIDHRITSAHHPEANGSAERMVKTIKAGLSRYNASVKEKGDAGVEWDMFLPYVALGYRMTPHESTKLSPYQMLYACTPVVPPHVMERISGPLNFDDPEIASQSILAKALILQEYCITAGHNLFIAQHRDTLRYAKLHSGGYLPSAHKFSVGQFVYVRNWKVLHKEARPEVLRILDIRPTGVLVLIGRDGVKIVENVVNCSPCHLPIDEIDAPSTALIRPSKNYTCSVCDSPQREDVMLICDSCQLGFHTFCLNPPLSDLPTEDIWICSPCLDAGVTPAVIKAVWSHPQFQADARLHDARVLQRIKPRGRGRPPETVIPTNPAPSSTQSVLVPP
ncbi:hypothetical protein CEUSTIGMA_g13724.t1, partial [Chlamydomonas eustigma]